MTAALAGRRRLAGAALSAAIIAGLVVTADAGDLARAVRDLPLGPVALAAGLYLANGVLKALRWWVLLRAAGVSAGPVAAYRAFLVGMAVSNLLPSGLAGEPVRLAQLEGRVSPEAAGAATVDRVLDAAVLAAVGAAALPVLAGLDPDAVWPTAAAIAGIAAALAAVTALVWRRWRLARIARRPGSLSSAALLTLPIQANDAVRLVVIATAYGIDLGLLRAAGIVALATVAGLLTIVGGGAGMALTIGALLAAAGAGPTAAVATSLVFIATSTWLSYPLGALAALTRRAPRPRPPEELWT